jgi:hypothetical protein
MKCVTITFFLTGKSQEYPGFRFFGRHLNDKCGEKVILRGAANPIAYECGNGNVSKTKFLNGYENAVFSCECKMQSNRHSTTC